jgi:hypothetical protein
MAGLVPAIHVFIVEAKKGVDARHKAGHDEFVLKSIASALKLGVAFFLERLDAFQPALVRHADDVEFVLVT